MTLAPIDPPAVLGGLPYLTDYMKLAGAIAKTEMVPDTLRGRPDAILAVILAGHELGVGPMQSLQGIDIIQGRPAPSAELMRALVARNGHTLVIIEGETEAVARCHRREWDADKWVSYTFSMDDAKRANLAGKGGWRSYPRAMLVARVTAAACRYVFADVIAGLSYVPEEVESFAAKAPVGLSTPGEVVLDAEVTEPPHDALTGELEASLGAQGVDAPPTDAPPVVRDTVRGPPSAVQALNAPLIHAALDNEAAVASPGPDDVPLFGSDGIEPPEPPWERQVREDPAGTPATKAKASKGAGRAQEIADRHAGRS